ncbi:MAG: hypothetical protein ACPGSC_12550 [Granulosicoccaceae bacterium]
MIEHKINVELRLGANRTEARIACADRSQVYGLFQGLHHSRVGEHVKRVYNVCSEAQQLAAQRAVHSALGLANNAQADATQSARAKLECLREQLLHIARCWGRLIDEPEAMHSFAPLYRVLANACASDKPQLDTCQQEKIAHWLFDKSASQWSQQTDSLTALRRWCDNHNTLAAHSIGWTLDTELAGIGQSELRRLNTNDLPEIANRLRRADSTGFCQAPRHQNSCLDNSICQPIAHPLLQAVEHRYGHGLLWRQLHRLLALARSLQSGEPTHTAAALEDLPVGTAAVATARGWLVHAIEFEDEHVSRFRALAPTEWNFHCDGLAKRCLERLDLRHPTPVEKQARAVIDAIDPCMGYSLRVH